MCVFLIYLEILFAFFQCFFFFVNFAGPRKGSLGAQHTSFQGPIFMHHTIDAYSTRGLANIVAMYAVPMTPGRSRIILRQPVKIKNKMIRKALDIIPQFMDHLINISILDDDIVSLHIYLVLYYVYAFLFRWLLS